jgi:hypothetical protein
MVLVGLFEPRTAPGFPSTKCCEKMDRDRDLGTFEKDDEKMGLSGQGKNRNTKCLLFEICLAHKSLLELITTV